MDADRGRSTKLQQLKIWAAGALAAALFAASPAGAQSWSDSAPRRGGGYARSTASPYGYMNSVGFPQEWHSTGTQYSRTSSYGTVRPPAASYGYSATRRTSRLYSSGNAYSSPRRTTSVYGNRPLRAPTSRYGSVYGTNMYRRPTTPYTRRSPRRPTTVYSGLYGTSAPRRSTSLYGSATPYRTTRYQAGSLRRYGTNGSSASYEAASSSTWRPAPGRTYGNAPRQTRQYGAGLQPYAGRYSGTRQPYTSTQWNQNAPRSRYEPYPYMNSVGFPQPYNADDGGAAAARSRRSASSTTRWPSQGGALEPGFEQLQ